MVFFEFCWLIMYYFVVALFVALLCLCLVVLWYDAVGGLVVVDLVFSVAICG